MQRPEPELPPQTEKPAGVVSRLLFHPWASSLLVAASFFATYLFLLRPGYNVNDDIDNIGLVSGYFTGEEVSFVPNSNVPWGNLVSLLYTVTDKINWEVLVFIAIDFISVWLLLGILFSLESKPSRRLFGLVAVLVCDSYFLLNITFTTISAFAALAGLCAILMATRTGTGFQKVQLTIGVVLILVASLIRIQPILLVLLTILPAMLVSYRVFDLKKLLIMAGATGLLVLGCWLFNGYYVGLSPDWAEFYQYNIARQALKDTPRLSNIGNQYQDVGWSKNDLKEFEGWFFPDKKVYSLQSLQYLVAHVPSQQKSKVQTALLLARAIVSPESLPYILLILASGLGLLLGGQARRTVLPLSVLLASAVVIEFYLAWTMKIPDRVLLPSLATVAIFSLCLAAWAGLEKPEPAHLSSGKIGFSRFTFGVIAVLALGAAALAAGQAIQITRLNILKQAAYRHILTDLDAMQARGEIAQNALILAPAYGIPLEWSNPLVMDFPNIRYLDMGWLTLSPAYDTMLREFGVSSIPAGFYQQHNVYLMTRSDSVAGILQYIKEHEGLEVKVTSLYSMPDDPGQTEYQGVHLYRLEPLSATPGG